MKLVPGSRWARWGLVILVGSLVTLTLLWKNSQRVSVAVYNDTDLPWAGARISVGAEIHAMAALQPREGAVEHFTTVSAPADLRISGLPVPTGEWSAPYLVHPDTARITLHFTRTGGVTTTVEPRLAARISKMLD